MRQRCSHSEHNDSGNVSTRRNVTNCVSPASSRCGKYPRSCHPRNPRFASSTFGRDDHCRLPATISRTPGLCGGPGRPGFGGRLTRSIQPQRRRIRKLPERDCAESQSQQCSTCRDVRTFRGRLSFERCCGWSATQPRSRPRTATVCKAPVAAASPAGTRGNEFERVELRMLLRLTEPRSGAHLCEAQRLALNLAIANQSLYC